jgi:hypothetical protein
LGRGRTENGWVGERLEDILDLRSALLIEVPQHALGNRGDVIGGKPFSLDRFPRPSPRTVSCITWD